MRKRIVPDWALKGFLTFAMVLFTAQLAGWLISALQTGSYVTRSGIVVTVASDPSRFGGRMIGTAFATLVLLCGTLACFGWVPRIGRVYKKWLSRLASRSTKQFRRGPDV